MLCARCFGNVSDPPDSCVACHDLLCPTCWEEHGHCGHPEVEAMNEELRTAPASARGAIMERYLGSIGAPKVPPLKPRTH